jgi:cell division protein FtsW (lipid II flippase)
VTVLDDPQAPKADGKRNQSVSQIYAICTVLLLIVAILVNQPRVTVAVSAVGLIAGVFVLRRGDVRRVAMVAMAGLAAALVMGVFGLLQ